jgi:formylglycine-generating enzyme required for sulfatase activity
MGYNPSSNNGCNQCPVEQVSWNDVQAFLQKINSRGGLMLYRLPSEAEWEYAARGGTKSRGYIYAGGNILRDVGWYNFNAENKSQPVKSKQANELGLYDMSGNVWEWCSDVYGGSTEDFTEPNKAPERVYRGGSWYYPSQHNRIPYRNYANENGTAAEIGFRLVMTAY